MNLARLTLRSIAFYWGTGLVVALGVAVATAVIVGSLIVGDSVTASVRKVALQRLGKIDHALVAPRFFRTELAPAVARAARLDRRGALVVPVILRTGAVRVAGRERAATAPKVTVVGVDDAFWNLFPGSAALALRGREVAVNAALARDLRVRTGDALLLRVGRRGRAPADSLFGRRDPGHTSRRMRLRVAAVLPASGAGGFSLSPGTGAPRTLFLPRSWLAGRLGEAGGANAILVASGAQAGGALADALRAACSPRDHGLRLVLHRRRGYVSVESTELVLRNRQVEAAVRAAKECSARAFRTSIYLADRVAREGAPKVSASYVLIAGYEPLASLPVRRGTPPAATGGVILVNTWLADDLQAKVGDTLAVSYLVPAPDGTHWTRTVPLAVQAIVPIAGPALDPGLVPEFQGVTDVAKVTDWDPPFPFDRRRVTGRDDAYWERYRATPKAFVSLETAREMWTAAGGRRWITSVRAVPPKGVPLDAFAKRFEAALLRSLSPADSGLVFRPVRREAVEASKGSTDFAGLFLAMSMFLVLSGAGLAGMLMRLLVERRSAEMGMLLACGFRAPVASRWVTAEGAVLALAGAGIGVPLGVGYAAAVIHALRTGWRGAVGSAPLWLSVEPASVAVGFACGLAAGLLAVWWGVRSLRRRRVLELLRGWRAAGVAAPRRAVRARTGWLLAGSLLVAIVLVALSAGLGVVSPEKAFFGSGAALLAAGLLACRLVLISAAAGRGASDSLARLAVRSAAAHRGRSLLAVGLLACASFVIVTVAANERDFGRLDPRRRDSGTGGFSLRAVSSLPIHYDFGTPSGRKRLGFDPKDEAVFRGVRVYSFLLAPGEDISCLNLARPSRPAVLGVGRAMIERGGFRVRTLEDADGNPWRLLSRPPSRDAVPAFGDSESIRWQLHKALGDTMEIPDHSGRPVTLRFVGAVASSILASELLVSEESFRRMFPSETGPRYFLIETPPGREEAVADALRRNLGEMGLEVRATREILNDLIGVQNTYLMTFLALGGLGVLLGTVGLVVVLLRNALERRAEFALMLATGFRRRFLAALLVAENAGLLLAGLFCGTVAALAAVAPQLASVESHVRWPALAGWLLGIMAVGLVSCVAAAVFVVRGRLVRALRAE